jgi:hypothetical protein
MMAATSSTSLALKLAAVADILREAAASLHKESMFAHARKVELAACIAEEASNAADVAADLNADTVPPVCVQQPKVEAVLATPEDAGDLHADTVPPECVQQPKDVAPIALSCESCCNDCSNDAVTTITVGTTLNDVPLSMEPMLSNRTGNYGNHFCQKCATAFLKANPNCVDQKDIDDTMWLVYRVIASKVPIQHEKVQDVYKVAEQHTPAEQVLYLQDLRCYDCSNDAVTTIYAGTDCTELPAFMKCKICTRTGNYGNHFCKCCAAACLVKHPNFRDQKTIVHTMWHIRK